MGPACQADAETSKTMLVYTTAPLERDVVLIGDVSATLFAASSAVDTDFAVRLCVVDEGGCSRNLQEGIVRARFRDSLSEPTPITPVRCTATRSGSGPSACACGWASACAWTSRSRTSRSGIAISTPGGVSGREAAIKAVVVTQVVLHDAEHPSA